MSSPKYLIDQGLDRERVAVERWMFPAAHDLPTLLGLGRAGWWMGLFLSRDAVFGDGKNGDVDLLAGPLRYTFGPDEWEARVRAEEKNRPHHPGIAGLAREYAHHQAAADGCIEWPPRLDDLVGCEFKASYFDGRWKSQHINEGRQILGQLKYLRRKGLRRLAFGHIASTSPPDADGSSSPFDPYDAALSSFPMIREVRDSEYGYFQFLFGASRQGIEGQAGVVGVPRIVGSPRLLDDPCADRSWHRHLRERFAAMPAPPFINTFVLECRDCRAWRFASWAELPCACRTITGRS